MSSRIGGAGDDKGNPYGDSTCNLAQGATDMLRASTVRYAALFFGILFMLQLSACGVPVGNWRGISVSARETTYEKLLVLAEAGDVEGRNAVGFMLFHGEGVSVDLDHAEMWFWLAAEQGDANGRRNLAFMRSMDRAAPRRESNRPSTESHLPGEASYGKFCAGCHGFNGFSAYVYSPSFALGQALEKSDEELMRSLLNGKGEMPEWGTKLSRAELRDILHFVRALRSRFDAGLGAPLRGAPPLYYLFGPMEYYNPGLLPVP